MVVNSIIIVVSLALFAYWFRYSCVLILSAQTSRDFAAPVVASMRLSVSRSLAELRGCAEAPLGRIHADLDQDYARVRAMLTQAGEENAPLTPIEQSLLKVDYSLMRRYATLCLAVSPRRARQALIEMGSIVHCLANAAGSAGAA